MPALCVAFATFVRSSLIRMTRIAPANVVCESRGGETLEFGILQKQAALSFGSAEVRLIKSINGKETGRFYPAEHDRIWPFRESHCKNRRRAGRTRLSGRS